MTTTTLKPSKPKYPCQTKEARAAYYKANKARINELQKASYANNVEARRIEARERYHADPSKHCNSKLKAAYGITLEQRDEMFAAQGFVCAVCKTDTPTKAGWATDHCHTTKKVRGILCSRCNVGLGYFKDNPATLAAAITYLGK